jgi:hypothetical protein
MRQGLFSRSWHDVHNARVRAAIQDVEKLDRALFSSPQLGGILEKIAAKQDIQVAAVTRDGVHAEARTENRDQSDYGLMVSRSYKVLDVTIPITGSPETLTIAPSSRPMISANYELRGSTIVLRVTDNERAGGEIDSFIKQVNETLNNLRQEIARYEGKVLEAAQQAAQKRKVEIEDENRRDQSRTFPVTRRS